MEKLFQENILLMGNDSGNTKDKTSYLDNKGNIASFEIAKVIAAAPATKLNISGPHRHNREDAEVQDVEMLHVMVQSKSLDHKDNGKSWYVGSYAKDKDGKIETKLNQDGSSEEKFNLQNKALHIITLLTGIAVGAMREGKTNVNVPFSGGMPIEDYKNRGGNFLKELLLGQHEVRFIDGVYEGKTVNITIDHATINIEGVHSTLALEFDIQNGEIVELDLELPESYILNDLGAGTSDNAVFYDDVLDKTKSTNSFIGTNKYIDAIIADIKAHLIQLIDSNDKYAAFREYFKDMEAPIKSREEFVKTYLEPEIDKMLENKDYQPKFFVKWGPVKGDNGKGIDVSEIVLNHLIAYGKEQEKDLMGKWINTSVDKLICVGGGVLFGYPHFVKLAENKDFILPANIKESPYFTSRSYLISNFVEQLDREAVKG